MVHLTLVLDVGIVSNGASVTGERGGVQSLIVRRADSHRGSSVGILGCIISGRGGRSLIGSGSDWGGFGCASHSCFGRGLTSRCLGWGGDCYGEQ